MNKGLRKELSALTSIAGATCFLRGAQLGFLAREQRYVRALDEKPFRDGHAESARASGDHNRAFFDRITGRMLQERTGRIPPVVTCDTLTKNVVEFGIIS